MTRTRLIIEIDDHAAVSDDNEQHLPGAYFVPGVGVLLVAESGATAIWRTFEPEISIDRSSRDRTAWADSKRVRLLALVTA